MCRWKNIQATLRWDALERVSCQYRAVLLRTGCAAFIYFSLSYILYDFPRGCCMLDPEDSQSTFV